MTTLNQAITKIHPNVYFDQIYLINLPRRPDKLTKVLQGLDQYNIRPRVISAIDGYHPQIHGVQSELPPGAYGYLLTWKEILRDAIQMKYKRILLLDDDVILRKDFLKHFDFWIRKRPANWKILLLGATQHTAKPVTEAGIDAYVPKHTDGSFAVSLQGPELIKEVFKLIKPDTPKYVDSDILRGLYKKYQGYCWVADPNLMIANVTDSDIRGSRDQATLSAKVGWNLDLYNYPLTRPLVSIIVPCYNAERTIKRCLESLLDQTYRPIEVIVVDDGSKDRSFQIVGELYHKWQFDPKAVGLTYKIFKHGKNLGCYAARNDGLKLATGKLIGFQDADDISLKYRIEDQVNALLNYGVLFTTCNILRTHLHYLPTDPGELSEAIQRTRVHPDKWCCRSKVGLVTTLFRRSVFDTHGLYPNSQKWGEDATYLRIRLFPELPAETSMMNYLNDNQYLPGKHYRVSEILYLSHEMTDQNLTIQRKKAHREKESQKVKESQ